MKIKGTNLEVSSIGDFESIESSIANKDLGLALTMVSKNLYSNPIGSFVRELASNAVDANVDANVDEAVLIHLYQEGSSYYIEFKDNGVGMSPDTFKNIYMSWFNSDKRDSNDKIGGWGLGSKSPLAYQDSFEIITRFDGTEYHYVLANEGNIPSATLLTTNRTSEHNGTTIRVEINEKDITKVHNEAIKQLAYFRSIYVKNDLNFYDNTFKIYESERYILRNKDQPFGTAMHICLGQVAYPINWNVLGLPEVKIPVGIKFKIGELDVTLSREEINYTEEVKALVLKRIDKVRVELVKKYEEQLQIENFSEYIKLYNTSEKPKFKIEDVLIDMGNISVTPSFKDLPNVTIVKKYIDDLFSFYSVEEIYRSSGRRRRHSGNSEGQLADYIAKDWRALTGYIVEGRLSTYDSVYLGQGIGLIRRKKIGKPELIKIAKALNLIANKKEYDNGYSYRVKPIFKEGYIKTIFKVVKYIDNYVKENFNKANGIAPEDWIENYKLEQQALYEERKQTITHYSIYNTRTTVNWGELIDRYKVIFYIDKEETKENIVAYKYLYEQLPSYFLNNSTFLIISPSVVSKVKNKPKFHSVEKIFKIKQFKNTLYRIKLSKIVDDEFSFGNVLFKYSDLYYRWFTNLQREYNSNYKTFESNIPVKTADGYKSFKDVNINLITHFSEEFEQVKPTKHRKYLKYEEYIEELKQVRDKLDILKYINYDCPHNHLVHIIERLGVLRLNAKYYKRINN